MNLLIEEWIPVRPLPTGAMKKISLKQLLCGNEAWELCLPRDDMELAAVQLLICMTQALLTPKSLDELKRRIAKPLTEADYDAAIKPFSDWFQLDHPTQPFMQVRAVIADKITPIDKLMPGLNDSTNGCFVNERELGEYLCGGCAAIALFNRASCSPSFGGGFKSNLRDSRWPGKDGKGGLSGTPVTTLIQGDHLRRSVWLNVLEESNTKTFQEASAQKPCWIEPIVAGEIIPAQKIGLARGLFWQPGHIELLPPVAATACSCCGCKTDLAYTTFKKAKFKYTVTNIWPHPHTPRIMISKNGEVEEKFVSFTTIAPSWTQLSRFVVQQQVSDKTEGQQPSAVINQVRNVYGVNAAKLHLMVGGYRNNQASVLERRHDVFTLNLGWDSKTEVVQYLVSLGRGYRAALYKALYVFVSGIKDVKGAGVKLHQEGEAQFYRRSESTIENTLARIDFTAPEIELGRMRKSLKQIAEDIFEESTQPYLRDPELIRTLAVSRRILHKHLKNLEPLQDKGGDNGTTEAP